MGKSPLILAALAADAVRSLKIVKAAGHGGTGSGRFDSAILTDDQGSHYIARIPTSPSAGTDLEVELRVLRALNSAGVNLPFEIPAALGETQSAVGERLVVFKWVYGNPIDPLTVQPNGDLANSIADALVAIHSIPTDLVVANGFRDFSVAENLRLRTAELDRAAQSGKVPAVLLGRWEQALEDPSLFRYQPAVVHGELTGESLLEQDKQVSGVIEWHTLELNDPAYDFSWLVPNENHELLDAVLFNYQLKRGTGDNKLAQRAVFYSEFKSLQYLLHGLTMRNTWVVEEATELLQELANQAQDGLLMPLTDEQARAQATAMAAAETDALPQAAPVTDINSARNVAVSFDDDRTAPIETKPEEDLF